MRPSDVTAKPQPDLPLFLVKRDHPNVELLVSFLRDHRDGPEAGWYLASQILTVWEQGDSDHNRRFVRALAEAAGAEIISGQRGYKWIGNATSEEVNHAASWLESQAKKMSERACAIRRRAHEIFG